MSRIELKSSRIDIKTIDRINKFPKPSKLVSALVQKPFLQRTSITT
jgi:hypothetical protein